MTTGSGSPFITSLGWLRSEEGQRALNDLAGRTLEGESLLGELSKLRHVYPAAMAAAAVEQTILRRKGTEKFADAASMFFIREALEQATGQIVSEHRAKRFAGYSRVYDLCCGIGGDALVMARNGAPVIGMDLDADRLAVAAANAESLGVADRTEWINADVTTVTPLKTDVIFCDPARRSGGRRKYSVEECQPPLSKMLPIGRRAAGMAVKLSPGVAIDELHGVGKHQLEFVSLDGELKEAVLWLGEFAETQPPRRATVLRRLDGFAFTTDTLLPEAASVRCAVSEPQGVFV